MRIIRKEAYREMRWRNGMGVSWEIAQEPPETEAFGWRLAVARIAADVPFSNYPGIDRYFTLIEGQGLDLDFAGKETLAVAKNFVPHFYPCDVPTACRLRHGPCRALNLFLKRGTLTAAVEIRTGTFAIDHPGTVLLFALDGPALAGGMQLETGDTAIATGKFDAAAGPSGLYVARLTLQ